MLTEELGPYNIFQRLRDSLHTFKWFPLDCINCTSIWVSVIVVVLLRLNFLYIFAFSSASIFINAIYKKLTDEL